MKKTHWTLEEIAILTEGYKTGMSGQSISEKVGRTEIAVRNKAKRIGIFKRSRSKYHGCSQDCFNCPYYDCLRPYRAFMKGVSEREEWK